MTSIATGRHMMTFALPLLLAVTAYSLIELSSPAVAVVGMVIMAVLIDKMAKQHSGTRSTLAIGIGLVAGFAVPGAIVSTVTTAGFANADAMMIIAACAWMARAALVYAWEKGIK